MFDQLSYRMMPADCDSGRCQSCGVRRAQRRAVMITHRLREAHRPRFVTLTRAPEDWQHRRAQVRDLRRRIVATGLATDWIWTTEVGRKTGMVHVHALQTGDYIPQRALQRMWGDRIVDIRSAQPRHGEYISKSAGSLAQYVTKGATAHLDAALSLNGGRLHHWSRGWWGGVGVREYWTAMNGLSDADWIMVRAPEARAELDAARLEGNH